MSGFVIGYTTSSNGFVEIDGQQVSFWANVGPRTFSGTTEEFATMYPAVTKELIEHGIVRPM